MSLVEQDELVVCGDCLVPVMAGTDPQKGQIVWCNGGCGHRWDAPSQVSQEHWRAAWQYYRGKVSARQ